MNTFAAIVLAAIIVPQTIIACPGARIVIVLDNDILVNSVYAVLDSEIVKLPYYTIRANNTLLLVVDAGGIAVTQPSKAKLLALVGEKNTTLGTFQVLPCPWSREAKTSEGIPNMLLLAMTIAIAVVAAGVVYIAYRVRERIELIES